MVVDAGAQEPGGGKGAYRPSQVFGKVPFAFVKNVVQIAFLTRGCCKATSVCLRGYLSVGQLNNEK